MKLAGGQLDAVAGTDNSRPALPVEFQRAFDDHEDLIHGVGVEMMHLARGVALQFGAPLDRKQFQRRWVRERLKARVVAAAAARVPVYPQKRLGCAAVPDLYR